MSITIRTRESPAGGTALFSGPPMLFGTALAVTAMTFAIGALTLPEVLLPPLAVMTLFALAAATALLASLRRDPVHRPGVTYWDVAGALTLIGILAAAAIEPQQLVSLVEGTHRDPR